MSSIFIEDACALASKIEQEYDQLIQPSSSDKAIIILYRALQESQHQLSATQAERDTYRKALEQYADISNWSLIDGDWQWWLHPEYEDGNSIAREALKEVE